MNAFIERHQNNIAGVISCFDRVVLTGTLPDIGYAGAMTGYLSYHKIRIFDFPKWAQPLRDELRANAETIAAEAGIEIEFIRKHKAFRKEDRIKAILAERGNHPGLVHIFSAMEACSAYKPWHDKVGIGYGMADNAFLAIDDFQAAQRFADRLAPKQLHRRLDQWAKRFCPVSRQFRGGYHWSFMQAEYATDVLFHRHAEGQPLYNAIIREVVHTVKADQVATFLGRKPTGHYQGDVGNHVNTRIEGIRIRHQMGATSIDNPDAGLKDMDKMAQPARNNGRSYRPAGLPTC